MNKQVNPMFAAVLIICVLGFVGYFFWKANQDKPIPDGPGGGRIGRTQRFPGMPVLGETTPKTGEKRSAEAKSGAGKADEPKSGEAPAEKPAGK